jgi:tRNA (guanine37-N1)-methyltransferase
MRITVLTLFPGMFEGFLEAGIVRRALASGKVTVDLVDIRDSAEDKHRTVDDTPYGGGAGMVLKPDVMAKALKSSESFNADDTPTVVFLTPQGRQFDQSCANRLSLMDELILVCGRYRAVDERFRERYVTEEISIGDYVLTGGEPAAMVVVDAITRLIPGVLNDFESGIGDSFQDGFLDCPWYTRPEEFEGLRVPDVLLGGNHAKIRTWRAEQAAKRTSERRPDLLESDAGTDDEK